MQYLLHICSIYFIFVIFFAIHRCQHFLQQKGIDFFTHLIICTLDSSKTDSKSKLNSNFDNFSTIQAESTTVFFTTANTYFTTSCCISANYAFVHNFVM